MTDLSGIVKAYDVRGVVGEELDDAVVRDLGAALGPPAPRGGSGDAGRRRRLRHARQLARRSPPRSPRASTGQGLDVVSIGLASTDMLYYASGTLGLPGAMFTASHNPARYNGIKLCRAGATPIGQDTGLATIRAAVEAGVPAGPGGGRVTERDLLADYAAYLRGLVDLTGIRPLQGRRRRGQRHGRLHRARRARRPRPHRPRAALLRARRHLPQPRGQPARPGQPRGPAEARSSSRAPTSAWPSTATPTAASPWTSAASR